MVKKNKTKHYKRKKYKSKTKKKQIKASGKYKKSKTHHSRKKILCYHLNNTYNKWNSLHNVLFNDFSLSKSERNELQDKLVDTIINEDLDITPSSNYYKINRFIQSIYSCNDNELLEKLHELLQQLQTADTIPFSVFNKQIGKCPYGNKCKRDNKYHKFLYHSGNFFTIPLIESIQDKLNE